MDHARLFQPFNEGGEARHAEGEVAVSTAVFRAASLGIGVRQFHQMQLLPFAQSEPGTGEAEAGTLQRLEVEHVFIEAPRTRGVGHKDADVVQGKDDWLKSSAFVIADAE